MVKLSTANYLKQTVLLSSYHRTTLSISTGNARANNPTWLIKDQPITALKEVIIYSTLVFYPETYSAPNSTSIFGITPGTHPVLYPTSLTDMIDFFLH